MRWIPRPNAFVVSLALAAALPVVPLALAQSGSFRGDQYPAAGTARIVEGDDGRRFVELGPGFRTQNGPDLLVLLHKAPNPRAYRRSQYVSLGLLRRVRGRQRYRIPDRIDVSQYRSVVIWCREFDVTFAHAPLR